MSSFLPTRRDLLLGATLAGSTLAWRPARAQSARPRRLIVVLADGGWDVSYSFDPKLGVASVDGPELGQVQLDPTDVEEVRTFADIPILCNEFRRPSVTRFFEGWADRSAVINGVATESIVHLDSKARVLTGTGFVTSPDVATIVGHTHGADVALGTVDLGGRGFIGPLAASAGRVGTTSQLATLVDPNSAFPAPAGAGYLLPTYAPSAAEQDLVAAHLHSRLDLFRTARADDALNTLAIAGLEESVIRKERLVSQGSSILSSLLPGYTPNLLQQTPLALDLLAAGVCQTVSLTLQGWDSHQNNFDQHALHEQLFLTLEELAAGLVENGLFEDTLVVVCSEMGRTPRLNSSAGKDHWPHTSMLVFGGGVRGGRAYGATDGSLEGLPVDFATGELADAGIRPRYDHFAAGLLQGLDVDPQAWLPGVAPFSAPFV